MATRVIVNVPASAKRGDEVQPGQVLATIYARDEPAAERAADEIRALITIADEPQPPRPIVLETLA